MTETLLECAHCPGKSLPWVKKVPLAKRWPPAVQQKTWAAHHDVQQNEHVELFWMYFWLKNTNWEKWKIIGLNRFEAPPMGSREEEDEYKGIEVKENGIWWMVVWKIGILNGGWKPPVKTKEKSWVFFVKIPNRKSKIIWNLFSLDAIEIAVSWTHQ